MMANGVTLLVVVWMPVKLKLGCIIAFRAAMTSGKKAGEQPAITALAAIFSTVALPFRGGMMPRSSSPLSPPASIISRTTSGVGGMTGSPSVHPRSTKALKARVGADGTNSAARDSESEPSLTAEERNHERLFPVSASIIRSTDESARAFNAASDMEPTGCGTFINGRLPNPRVSASALARTANSSVTIVAVAIPADSSLTESWILHDVQEPQSAKALMTRSQLAIKSWRQSASVRVIFRLGRSSMVGDLSFKSWPT